MRPSYETGAALLASALILPATVSAITMDCKHMRDGGVDFNFEKLGGPKALSLYEPEPPGHRNTTFTIDICKPLDVPKDKKLKSETCKSGTQICGVSRKIPENGEPIVEEILPIARNAEIDGSHMETKKTLLSKSDSNEDSEKEGLRVEIKGGKYVKKPLRAVIEFLCKREDGDEEKPDKKLARREDEDDKEGEDEDGEGDDEDDDDDDDKEEWGKYKKTDDGEGGSLELFKWDVRSDEDVLRLTWHTKFACEDYDGNDTDTGSKPSGGWGFFSWFFFLLFLGVVGYFGFFAWVNYSKYGAHGWDLLPHSDTIRDIPYILGDWGRKVVGTFTGGPSRGGYSAV